jgi:hypothetical protein
MNYTVHQSPLHQEGNIWPVTRTLVISESQPAAYFALGATRPPADAL